MKKILPISACVIISCLLLGCKKEAINFYRESKVTQMMKEMDLPEKKSTTQKSSGVIIYKDESQTNSTGRNIQFGPRDLNFDIQIK